jgi:hypothetical protein
MYHHCEFRFTYIIKYFPTAVNQYIFGLALPAAEKALESGSPSEVKHSIAFLKTG